MPPKSGKAFVLKAHQEEALKNISEMRKRNQTIAIVQGATVMVPITKVFAFRQILYEEFERKYIFNCGKPLLPDKINVDPFIPCSFIKVVIGNE